MSLHEAGMFAGTVSTALFVGSYLPMLAKAARTRDLSSYSLPSLLVANLGNAVQTVYVASLPLGPIWVLHGFYLVSTAVMLCWWWRYRCVASGSVARTRRARVEPEGKLEPVPPHGGLVGEHVDRRTVGDHDALGEHD